MNYRLITLWQPYATLLTLGIKTFETRHWFTNYRGEILIHAAARKPTPADKRLYNEAIQKAHKEGWRHDLRLVPFPEQLPLGFILAIANLERCYRMVEFSEHNHQEGIWPEIGINQVTDLEKLVGDWKPNRTALKFTNIERLRAIPFKSHQGKILSVDINQPLLKNA